MWASAPDRGTVFSCGEYQGLRGDPQCFGRGSPGCTSKTTDECDSGCNLSCHFFKKEEMTTASTRPPLEIRRTLLSKLMSPHNHRTDRPRYKDAPSSGRAVIPTVENQGLSVLQLNAIRVVVGALAIRVVVGSLAIRVVVGSLAIRVVVCALAIRVDVGALAIRVVVCSLSIRVVVCSLSIRVVVCSLNFTFHQGRRGCTRHQGRRVFT